MIDGRGLAMGYVIAAGPRSGSWLLSELLDSTGTAGRPNEYACRADVRTWRDFHGCATHLEYFFRYPSLMRTPNGMLGTKLLYPQWLCLDRDVRRYLRRPGAISFLNGLGGPLRVIRLCRADLVRQAVSLALAQRTGRWSRRDSDAPHTKEVPEYDADAVRAALRAVRWQHAGWESVLSSLDAPVLRLTYEELAAAPIAVLRRALDFLGLAPPESPPRPRLRRQADSRSEQWVRRARRDLADLLDPPPG